MCDNLEYVESGEVTRDYVGSRGTKTTISDVSVKKRVLLVCVYNKKGTLITHDIIYRLFMKYGEIFKILIFEKCKNWKIFVEMETLESAEKARDALNNHQLFEDGSKMTVYYAKVDQIVFQNNNSGGVDYRELKRRKQINSNSSSLNQNSNAINNNSTMIPNLITNGLKISEMPPRHPTSNGNAGEKHRNYSFDYSELYRDFESVPNINSRPSPLISSSSIQKRNSLFQPINHPIGEIFQNSEKNETDQKQQELSKTLEEQLDHINLNDSQSEQGFPYPIETYPIEIQSFQYEKNKNIVNNENESQMSGDSATFKNFSTNQIPIDSLPASNISTLLPLVNGFPARLHMNELTDGLEDEEEAHEQLKTCKQITDVLSTPHQEKIERDDPQNGSWDGIGVIDPSQYVNPLYILENKKSRVIYVRGLQKCNLSTKKIYNLFSNFGNIELILYFTEKRYCLIQFETQEDATTAKEHLDSLKVEQNQMRIFYSNYESIRENQEADKLCETWKGERSTFRFRNGKQISVNPVTNTLHVSNLKMETCKFDVITEKFSPYGVIEGFHAIMHANKFMCHVKFTSTEDATNALCNLHEEEILGRKMHISFTRTRISPITTPVGIVQQTQLQNHHPHSNYNHSNVNHQQQYNSHHVQANNFRKNSQNYPPHNVHQHGLAQNVQNIFGDGENIKNDSAYNQTSFVSPIWKTNNPNFIPYHAIYPNQLMQYPFVPPQNIQNHQTNSHIQQQMQQSSHQNNMRQQNSTQSFQQHLKVAPRQYNLF